MDTRPERRVLLGRIVGLHGVQGWVKLESWTQPRDRIFRYQPWLVVTAATERELRGVRGQEQGKGLIAQLPGVTDRDQAQAWVGSEIWVPRSALAAAAPGEYYWTDLEGLAVVTTQGVSLGTVSHLFGTGANDVLVAKDTERERLIPFVIGDYVKEVDLAGGRVIVDWDPEF